MCLPATFIKRRVPWFRVACLSLCSSLALACPSRSLTTKIMDKKRSPNRLIVDEATNDDNSVRTQG